MVNDLILIDGQEAFVDLELLENWVIYTDGCQRASGFANIPDLSFGKEFRGKFAYIPSVPQERNMLISIHISYKNLSELYYDVLNDFDNQISEIKNKMNRARSSVSKKKYNEMVRDLLKKKSNNPGLSVNYNVIYSLMKILPKKYYARRNQTIDLKRIMGREMQLRCSILKIRVVAIPYLENQYQLKRIDLSNEELSMVKAMKELLKVKEEGSTFDAYISKWAKKLILNCKNK